jgi:hypothetical protein
MTTDRPNIGKSRRDADDDDAPSSSSSSSDRWDDDILYHVAVDPFERIASSGREEGRSAGLRDGYLAGLNIGTSKGWEVGLELGYYRDFARGILSEGIDEQRPSSSATTTLPAGQSAHRMERCRTLAGEVSRMIDEFPDPDSLLSRDDRQWPTTEEEAHHARERTGRRRRAAAAAASSGDGCSGDGCSSDGCSADGCSEQKSVDGGAIDFLDSDEAAMTMRSTDQAKATMLDVSASLERIRAKFKLLCILLRTKQSFDLRRVLELGSRSGEAGGGPDRRGMNDTEAVSTSSYETIENAGGGKSISHGPLGNAAHGESSSALESDW